MFFTAVLMIISINIRKHFRVLKIIYIKVRFWYNLVH